ncbi:hypothetical protein FN846DRAFT_897055 [Sphaerosporella brunnea]|uniref:SH3 domain-containing protein n=1 Tax=Sphaerosporella brunnea TaxID=1250544 RepID=A0A5J5FA53_9PEZI|nr:hypothetical protein FN846DRAFT_897055 [Sphaerosporella brunnea]
MSKTIHRQIGRFQTRSADDASVAMIIKEVEDTDVLLGKLVEHTKSWRDGWTDILVNATRLADSFHDVYQTIPRTGDSVSPPEPTPREILQRVAKLHAAHNELKDDMLAELDKVDRMLLQPMTDCRQVLKPIKKAIEKREHKKLDFERWNKAVESAKAKKNKSDKEYAGMHKSEAELEKATTAYSIADDYIREHVPPVLAKIVDLLPLIIEIAVQIQHTLCQHSYSQLYHYANEHGFTDPDNEVVIAEWEELFMPVKAQVESELRLIAKGKAVLLPMNAIQDNSILKKMPSIRNPLAKGKSPPPPPPSAAAVAANGSGPPPPRGRENSHPGLDRPKSSTSMSSRYSRTETSPPPPIPAARPSIGSVRAASHSSMAERDESPPPPLPGPRPKSNGSANSPAERPRMSSHGSSYGGGSVTPTPLAGLRPTALTAGRLSSTISPRSPSPNAGKIGGSLAPAAPTAGARSPSPSLAALVAGKKKPPPPPPKKKFLGPKEAWVKAIYAFEGQNHGDLSFDEGERIKVLKKTGSTDDWWEGECNGRKGQFPANYCEPA